MKGLAGRIGHFRVAALLVGAALALDIVRSQALAPGSPWRVACTVGEIALLVAASVPFALGRRAAAARHGSRERRSGADSGGEDDPSSSRP